MNLKCPTSDQEEFQKERTGENIGRNYQEANPKLGAVAQACNLTPKGVLLRTRSAVGKC